MSSHPSVAALVPVRTPAPHLAEALAAVLAQDPAPSELVVVDDGSVPPLELDPVHAERCILVRREHSGGPAAAREAGLAASGAELIALADADDVWEPGKLAAQLDALAREPDAALCFGRARIVGPDGLPSGERWEEPPAGVLSGERLCELLFERNPIPASSVVLRRAALEAAGGFPGPAPLGSDWDLWLRLAARGERFVCEPRAAIRYRRHRGGVTADVEALAEASLAIHSAHASLVPEPLRRRARARDLTALARGRVRRRDYAGAGEALREAAALEPPGSRERLLALALRVPLARELLGRRRPHR